MAHSRILFLKEFLAAFHTTGAIAPSGKALARRMVAPLDDLQGERRILEAGPGTGVFTSEIIARLKPGDDLIVCEINPKFADHLRHRLDTDPVWKAKVEQVRIECADVRDVLEPSHYDLIVSGLPLNNFEPSFVRELLTRYVGALKPLGVHTFFEYQGVRSLKRRIGTNGTRLRMKELQEIFDSLPDIAGVSHYSVFLNIPPAYAYELRPRK